MVTILKNTNKNKKGMLKVKCSCGLNYYTNNLQNDIRCKKCLSITNRLKEDKSYVVRTIKADVREFVSNLEKACEGELDE